MPYLSTNIGELYLFPIHIMPANVYIRAKFKQNVWHVHSPTTGSTRYNPDRGSPVDKRVASPIPTRTSPTTTLRFGRNQRKLSVIEDLDIKVTEATPPIEKDTPAESKGKQPPLWLSEGQTDLRNFEMLLLP